MNEIRHRLAGTTTWTVVVDPVLPYAIAGYAPGDLIEVQSRKWSQSRLATVAGAPAAPVAVGALPPLELATGQAFSVPAAGGFSGAGLSFSLVSAPAWMTIQPSTGVISGTAPASPVATTVTVRASNSSGHADSAFAANVTSALAAPTAAGALPDVDLDPGEVFSIPVAGDFTGAQLTFSLVSAPAWMSIDAGTGVITGTAPASPVTAGVTARASNAAGQADSGFSTTVASATPTLAIPGNPFPVALQRSASGYSVPETGETFLAAYAGATWHLAPTGDDATGDGSSGAPWRSIDKAVASASALDRIQMAAGTYATPAAIGKSVALLGPASGYACIGAFFTLGGLSIVQNIQTASDAQPVTLWTVPDPASGQTVMGFVRKDGARPRGYIGNGGVGKSVDNGGGTPAADMQQRGVPVVYTGGTSALLGSGTADTIPSLVSGGHILAWTDAATTGVVVAGAAELYVGPRVVIANYATNAISAGATGSLILDRCDVYGGASSAVSADTTGRCLLFGAVIAGAGNDCVDYRSTCTGVEVGARVGWPTARDVANNTSTAHENARILRVGGVYEGGSRTIHDIGDVVTYTFSCTIRDAVNGDGTLYRIGRATGPDATTGVHGDLTLEGVHVSDLVLDAGAAMTAIELADAWPY